MYVHDKHDSMSVRQETPTLVSQNKTQHVAEQYYRQTVGTVADNIGCLLPP